MEDGLSRSSSLLFSGEKQEEDVFRQDQLG